MPTIREFSSGVHLTWMLPPQIKPIAHRYSMRLRQFGQSAWGDDALLLSRAKRNRLVGGLFREEDRSYRDYRTTPSLRDSRSVASAFF
jgi:hypothetical protein